MSAIRLFRQTSAPQWEYRFRARKMLNMLRNIKKKTNDDTARINGLNPVFCSGAVPLHSTHSQENEIQPRFSTPKTDGLNSVFARSDIPWRHSLRQTKMLRKIIPKHLLRFYIYMWKIKSSLFLLKMKMPTISVPNAQADA